MTVKSHCAVAGVAGVAGREVLTKASCVLFVCVVCVCAADFDRFTFMIARKTRARVVNKDLKAQKKGKK